MRWSCKIWQRFFAYRVVSCPLSIGCHFTSLRFVEQKSQTFDSGRYDLLVQKSAFKYWVVLKKMRIFSYLYYIQRLNDVVGMAEKIALFILHVICLWMLHCMALTEDDSIANYTQREWIILNEHRQSLCMCVRWRLPFWLREKLAWKLWLNRISRKHITFYSRCSNSHMHTHSA